ncbi:MAG: CBS domain-containing protein [Gammaproteobacteria bacterium]|jgi:acetoin utilization protein AcuB
MKQPMVKSYMTSFPYSVELEAPIVEARKMMLEHHVRHLPVTRDRELVGLISDRDIKLILGPEFDYPNPRDLTVEDAYLEHPYVVDLETPLVQVVRHMADNHIGSAIVMGHKRLAGIFTAMDACRALAEYLEKNLPDDGDEAA